MRLQFEDKLQVVDTKRKEKVMDAVIRSALTEEDHVARLREEKRKLLIEQKRLLALRDMQKSDANLQRKKDMLVSAAAGAVSAAWWHTVYFASLNTVGNLWCRLNAHGSGSCRRSWLQKRAQVVARQEAERQRKLRH